MSSDNNINNNLKTYTSSMISQNQNSHSISGSIPENEVTLTDAELIKLVEGEKRQLRVLNIENDILERTLMRLEPSLMNGVYQAVEYATKRNSNASLQQGSSLKTVVSKFGFMDPLLFSPSKMLISSSKASTRRVESCAKVGSTLFLSQGARINILERAELVSTEMEIQIANLDKFREKSARHNAILKAQLEEVAARESEIEKARETFRQQVQIEGWDKIAQRIPAEIWIRFMTEWLKIADTQIGKLRLRTSTFNSMYRKLKSQIKVKEELSESLTPVDFDKLKIENKESQKLIEQKFQQLMGLKKMTGDANLNLAIHKKLLMEQNLYLAKVLETIKKKEKQTVELDKESDAIQIQADILSQKLDEIRKIRMDYKVPDVMDYVSVKWVVTDLKHAIKMLEHRVRIQSIALSSLNKKMQTMSSEETVI